MNLLTGQIPVLHDYVQLDFYAGLMLLGVAQGFFLSILFFLKPHKRPFTNGIMATLVLFCALILLEILLGYSGLMTNVLFLVDFSESLVFAVGPLIWLLVRSVAGRQITWKQGFHFIPFVLYSLYHIPFLLENEMVKYNDYLWAFHPEVTPISVDRKFAFDPLHIRRNLHFFIPIHFGVYVWLIYRVSRQQRINQHANPYFLPWVRLFFVFLLSISILYLVIRFYFKHDLGDHFLAISITGWLFFITFKMLARSSFFQPVVKTKYEKSTLSDTHKKIILSKLHTLEATEFYTDPSLSLPLLAKRLGTTPHYLSQVLNEEHGNTYFAYVGGLRIEKAKQLLNDSATSHLKIEEIAERSGYLSTSAFTRTFKMSTGITPGAFRKKSF